MFDGSQPHKFFSFVYTLLMIFYLYTTLCAAAIPCLCIYGGSIRRHEAIGIEMVEGRIKDDR